MKHLRTKSFCPKCGIPVTRFDLETNLKKVRNLRIPILKSRIEKIKALKKYKINTVGSNSVIDNRFLDLIDILYKEQYKERILSNTEIGYKVNVTTLNTNKILNKKDPKIIEALLELRKNLK